MGLFRKQVTRNLPKNAEILEKNGQRHARWTTRGGGKQTALLVGEPGAERIRTQSSTWYARMALADGTRREVNTGCRDKSAASAWLTAREAEQERIRAGVLTEAELQRAGILHRPLGDALSAYAGSLADRGRSRVHVRKTQRYLERGMAGLRWRSLADLDGDRLVAWLSEQGFGARVCNHFIVAYKAFGKWATERGWLAGNPFERLERRNERADRRHVRRALTVEELSRLFRAARERPLQEALRGNKGPGERMGKPRAELSAVTRDRLQWLGETRAVAYQTAAGTGLRWGELRSVTLGAVRLDDDPPNLILAAKDEKARRGAVIPLSDDLAHAIGQYARERRARLLGRSGASLAPFPGALDREPLFDIPAKMAPVFHADCEAAGIPRMDSAGRVIDVHALRNTFGTLLAKSGVSLQVAQRAMRHSDPKLTMNTYTHLTSLDVKQALDRLPCTAPSSVAREVARNAVHGGHFAASRDNSTTSAPYSDTDHTVRTLTSNYGPCQRVANEKDGGPCRGRTCDLGIKSPLLYQLS